MTEYTENRAWEENIIVPGVPRKICKKCHEFKYEFVDTGLCLDCAMGVDNGK